MIESLVRPLRPAPLGLAAGLALLVALLHAPGVTGALVHILALFVVLRYGYMIIESGAWGGDGGPEFNLRNFNQGFEEPVKLVGVVALFALLHAAATGWGGTPAGLLVLLLVNLAAPASIMVIALESSFVEAVNPARIAAVMQRTGFDYLAACFVLALFSISGNIILDLLLAAVPPAATLFAYCFASYYYVLVVFFMVGWLVSRHRDELIG